MKNSLAALALLVCVVPAFSQPVKPLKKVLELKIPREGGANGAGVAWHPVQKKYYACMAGNASFALGVYTETGKRLSPEEQKTFFDIRGIWYNPSKKTLQMNGYDDHGWAEYKLNVKGFPDTAIVLFTGMIQPDKQSAGAFNHKANLLYFLNGEGRVDVYSMKDAIYLDVIDLHRGKTKASEIDEEEEAGLDVLEDYNNSNLIYTAIAGAELGLLNQSQRQVELYNIKTGLLVRRLSLPADAPAPGFLNFSYCNGTYWLFDKEGRIWKGYK
jgi:hypothetical protein